MDSSILSFIHVTHISVFVHDQFNFAGGEYLGQWDCETKLFMPKPPDFATSVYNSNFREFRNRHGLGGDFLVLSEPHSVENFKGIDYDYA